MHGGYNHTDNPIRSSDVTFNILAPDVVKDHLTLGTTYTRGKKNELTGASMYEWSLGVQYALKF